MDDKFIILIERFIANDHLSFEELKSLKEWVNSPANQLNISIWAHDKWEQSTEIESKVTFEQLISRLNEQYQFKQREYKWGSSLLTNFQKIAAILILPVVLLLSYLIFSDSEIGNHYCVTIAPNGQKSEIVLPDNTHIWLNSGTQLKYPSSFGKNNRDVFLTGEAYFEVAKDEHKPFIVHASDIAVKVLGTKFNVKAYSDDEVVETALLSGRVNLIVDSGIGTKSELIMNPGEKLNYQKNNKLILKSGFEMDEVVAWKNNKLIFRDDTFDNLVKKIERWYNVEVIYDKTLFHDKRLTVELLEGESLERLMQIIEKTIDVNCLIEKQKVYINSKKRSS